MIKMRNGSCATLLAIGLLSPLGCSASLDGTEEIDSVSEALTSASVAHMSPAGVVESQGNLYWTVNSHIGGRIPHYTNTVYRASKGSAPGQEAALYTETSISPSYFGSIAFGQANGVWYGYFVVDYGNSTVIKRVPLDGSSGAVVMTDLTGHVGPHTQLYADNSYLYFSDANGIYAMLFAGTIANPIVQAANISAFTVSPDYSYIYYAIGKQIYYVAKIGIAGAGQLADALYPVEMLSLKPPTTTPLWSLFWSDGTMVVDEFTGNFWESAGTGRMITSLDTDATHLLWTDCTTSGTACQAKIRTDYHTNTPPVVVTLADYARNIQADKYDGAKFFYTSLTDLLRVTYP